MKKRVLVLNCGTLASTDINMALRYNDEFEIWGASTNKNHGIYVYKNYIKLDKFDDWYRFLLLILGVLFVTLNQIFEIYFLKEIMLVAAWVVIWETVYDFLFKGSGRKIKSKMYKSLINAIVEFD